MKKIFFLLCLLLCFTCLLCACDEAETPAPDPDPAPTHTHEWGEWRTYVLATCTTEGQEKRLCSCGEAEMRTVPVSNEHTFTERSMTEEYECNSDAFQTDGVYYYKCSVCDAKGTNVYMTENARVYFGEYPQTLKAENVEITETTDSRGYFLGSDGAYYAKVSATPFESGLTFSSGEAVIGAWDYYFKVEPIAWRILSIKGSSALILCDSIIDNQPFSSQYGTNNYGNSTIRTWLNSGFLNTAFSAVELECVETSSITSNPGNIPEDDEPMTTEDKVFLLSKEELTNAAYGLNTNEARKMKASDYTKANGIRLSATWNGYSHWWQRDLLQSDNVYFINQDGRETYYYCVGIYDYVGVVPALTINFS